MGSDTQRLGKLMARGAAPFPSRVDHPLQARRLAAGARE
jgi:hypothetical protein